jgi:hypothetical protein
MLKAVTGFQSIDKKNNYTKEDKTTQNKYNLSTSF